MTIFGHSLLGQSRLSKRISTHTLKSALMFFNKDLLALLVFSCALLFTACGEDDETTVELKDTPELVNLRAAQLADANTYGITPAAEALTISTRALAEQLSNFLGNPTEQEVINLQDAWGATSTASVKFEMYDIPKSRFTTRLLNRSTSADEVLEDLANPDVVFDDAFFVRGNLMPVLEYLIFNDEPAVVITQIQADTRRQEFLVAAKDYLASQADLYTTQWDELRDEAISNTTLSPLGGQNRLANRLISSMRYTYAGRLNAPINEGMDNGEFVPYAFEAFYSKKSLDLLQASWQEWTRLFYRDFGSSDGSIGFDYYLIALVEQQLLQNIDDAVADINTKINQLTSIQGDLVNNPALLEEAFTAYGEMQRFIILDMAQAMCILIEYSGCDGGDCD